MPTLLDERLVADALTRLDGWSGGADRITRTVRLDAAQVTEVERLVAATAEAMDHHPDIERGDALTFALSTHSAGGVTELDIALASRIDDHVRAVTGTPPPPVEDRDDRDVVAEAGRATADGPGVTGSEEARLEASADTAEGPVGGLVHPSGRQDSQGVFLPDTAPGEGKPGEPLQQIPDPPDRL